jgi:hypothetical protein
MRLLILSIVIVGLLTATASAGKSGKTKVTNCSSYTYNTGTTKTTCRTK